MEESIIDKIWKDPVWSSVIASILVIIISQIFILIWSWIKNIGFVDVYKRLFDRINVFINKKEKSVINDKTNDKISDDFINIEPTVFFHQRFCAAFPGYNNGYKWFLSRKDIKNRLKILLASPTYFKNKSGHGVTSDPIWWFRGTGALPIKNFEILSSQKILINTEELKIEKIAAYRGHSYYQDFVYIQCLPDSPVGIYNHNQLSLEAAFENNDEYYEEFGVYKNHFISLQEYDDNSAIIKGKPVNVAGAKLRVRHLIKYNFIIAAKFSPYNCREFCIKSEEYFGKLLKNELDFDDFISFMKSLPKNDLDD
jgi:hypothetical protein